MGPLEVVAIECPGRRFRGEIMGALVTAVETGAIRIVDDSFTAPVESNKQSSTFVAYSENSAKLTPLPSQVAPRG